MNQVHGNNVVIVDENSSKLIDNCDGIITNKKFPLMVMVADCIPILFLMKKRCNCSCSCWKKFCISKNHRNYSKKMMKIFIVSQMI